MDADYLYKVFKDSAIARITERRPGREKIQALIESKGLAGFVEENLPDFLELSDEDRFFIAVKYARRAYTKKNRPEGESCALQILCMCLAPYIVRGESLRKLRQFVDRDGWITMYRGVGKDEAKLVRNGKFTELGIWWTPYRDKARTYASIPGGALVRIRVSIDQLKYNICAEQLVSVIGGMELGRCTRPKIVERGLLLRCRERIWRYKVRRSSQSPEWFTLRTKESNKRQQVLQFVDNQSNK